MDEKSRKCLWKTSANKKKLCLSMGILLTIMIIPSFFNNISLNQDISTNQPSEYFEGSEPDLTIDSSENVEESGDSPITLNNASQFDVYESAIYSSIQKEIDFKTETLNFDVPNNWQAQTLATSIPSVYTVENILDDDGFFNSGLDPWWFDSNYLYQGGSSSTSEVYTDYGYDTINENAYAIYNVSSDSIPEDYSGHFFDRLDGFDHDGYQVEINELFESETIDYPIYQDFLSDPEYSVLIDPYGFSKLDSEVFGYWEPSVDALRTDIDTSSSILFKGDPSVAFQTPFYIPYEADIVYVTFGWAVENLGYAKNSEFQVKARIDEQYINGETGAEGEDYSDMGTPTSLEDDYYSNDIKSHGVLQRTYDVSDMVGELGTRAGWHQLDFGCYMASPDKSTDDVNVYWDYVVITIAHQNWYLAADLNFDYYLDDLNGFSANDNENFALTINFGNPEDPERYYRYIVGTMSELVFDSWQAKSVKIPHIFYDAFNVNTFQFSIGLENINPYAKGISRFAYQINFDNIGINVGYVLGTLDTINLYGRVTGTTEWEPWLPYMEFPIAESNPGFSVEFYSDDLTTIEHPFLRLEIAGIYIDKYSPKAAEASAYIQSLSSIKCDWNVTYDNTQSMDEIDDLTLTNNNFRDYNLTILNLPAFDGLGSGSGDWNITDIISPIGESAADYADLWHLDDLYHQNGTVKNATSGNLGSLTRGVWTTIAHQYNYMVAGDLQSDENGPNEIFYDGDAANYTMEIRGSVELKGNYSVRMYNYSGDMHAEYPQFYNDVGNQTVDWTVTDQGVGYYSLIIGWNNTDSNNQTTRLGWWSDIFKIHRKTSGRVVSYPIEVNPGETAEYIIEINQTMDDIGIVGGNVYGYDNDTDNLWGINFSPYTYQVDYMFDLQNGRYKIGLKTQNVEVENYSVYFKFVKLFYDLNITEVFPLNISTIIPLQNIDVEYISGAFNYSDTEGYLTSDNNLVLNETASSQIVVKLNETGGNVLRDAYVSASFNGTETIMVAIEKFAYTHVEQDKGIYIIDIDTMGLNATDNISTYNYSMDISFAKPGYLPVFQTISAQINPVPLEFQIEEIINMYEGESFDISTSMYKLIDSEQLPCSLVDVEWSIWNSSDQLYTGILTKSFSNIFTTSIDIDVSNYLHAGEYGVLLNATGNNLETSYSDWINFTVFAKYVSNMSIILPDEVRIGGFISISAKLAYVNGTGISDKDIAMTINYSSSYSYEVAVTTDSQGRGIYEFSIPQQYEGENLTVYADFGGNELILGSWFNRTTEILGKIPVNITILNIPEYVQVGYNATFSMELSILGEQNYDGKIVYLYGFYDGSTQPFLVQELSTDSYGNASHTIDEIENGHDNISIYFEYLGSSAIESQVNYTTVTIHGKWNTTIDFMVDGLINDIPDIIRYGQTIDLNITVNSSDITFYESYAGLSVELIFDYTDVYYTYSYYLNENGTLLLTYTIPDDEFDSLNLTFNFAGTSKIQNYSGKIISTILTEKKSVELIIQTSPQGSLLQGTYFYSLNLTDQDGIPLSNVEVQFMVLDSSDNLVGEVYTGVTNDVGFASVSIDLSVLDPGDYSIIAVFDGDGIYAEGEIPGINIEVTTQWLIFLDYLPYIAGIIAAIVLLSLTIHKTVVVPRRIKRMNALQAIHQRFEDVENIQYILILTKSGLSLFSRSFTNVPIDENLVSGFLSAISSFGAEIGSQMDKNAESEKGLEQLSYKQFKIIVNDVALVRTAILLLKDASPSLKNSLRRFNLRFQEQYMDILSNFEGKIPPEGPILELVEKHLEVDLLYSHNINPNLAPSYIKSKDKKSIERIILEEAAKPKFSNTFKIRDMINHLMVQNHKEVMIFNGIDTLRNDRLVFAINPRTQYLIDQFRPIIDRLPGDAKKIIRKIADGESNEIKLRKIKKLKNFDENLSILREMYIIDESNKLTETGEAVATLIQLIPDI